MDFYLTSPSTFRFINDDTDEVIGLITDVKRDRRDYYFFGEKKPAYVDYTIEFTGMPPDTFPLPCDNVRLEIVRFGRDQDYKDYQRTLHIGKVNELHLASEITDADSNVLHTLTIRCYTGGVRAKE